jgi:hypothetical protein
MREVVGNSVNFRRLFSKSINVCRIQDEMCSFQDTSTPTLYSDAVPALIDSYSEGNNDVSSRFCRYGTNVFTLVIRNLRVTSVKILWHADPLLGNDSETSNYIKVTAK